MGIFQGIQIPLPEENTFDAACALSPTALSSQVAPSRASSTQRLSIPHSAACAGKGWRLRACSERNDILIRQHLRTQGRNASDENEIRKAQHTFLLCRLLQASLGEA